MWYGVILIGSFFLNSAAILHSPQPYGTEEQCQVWVDDAMSTIRARNTFLPKEAQVMAMAECRVTPQRPT